MIFYRFDHLLIHQSSCVQDWIEWCRKVNILKRGKRMSGIWSHWPPLISSLDAGPSSCHQLWSLKTHQKMSRKPLLSVSKSDDSRQQYKEAFSAYDWTNSGRISYSSLKVHATVQYFYCNSIWQYDISFSFQAAMRRCGQNPTDIEVSDIINKIHDDSGSLDLEVIYFWLLLW